MLLSIPAFIGSYFLASCIGDNLGNKILNKVTGDIAKQTAKESSASQLGGGAEIDG